MFTSCPGTPAHHGSTGGTVWMNGQTPGAAQNHKSRSSSPACATTSPPPSPDSTSTRHPAATERWLRRRYGNDVVGCASLRQRCSWAVGILVLQPHFVIV